MSWNKDSQQVTHPVFDSLEHLSIEVCTCIGSADRNVLWQVHRIDRAVHILNVRNQNVSTLVASCTIRVGCGIVIQITMFEGINITMQALNDVRT